MLPIRPKCATEKAHSEVRTRSPRKDFHRPIPIPALSPLLSKLRKWRRQCKHFPFVPSTSCFRGRGCRRSSWSSPQHASPPARACGAAHAGDVTRACCTPAISSTRRSPPRKKKNPQASPSEQASPVQRCGIEELLFFFFSSLTLATKCKTYPVVFNYMFTPYLSKDITTLP